MLGKRTTTHTHPKPHNATNVFLGTALLWFGWFGFNGGSAIAATPRAGMAAFVTTLAAAGGSLTWVLIDTIKSKKLSGIGYCSGAIAGTST
jgi:ammonium transporter, Amt family